MTTQEMSPVLIMMAMKLIASVAISKSTHSSQKTKAFVFFHNQPDGGGQTLDESRRFPSWRLAPLAGKLSPSAREFHPPLSEVLWNYRIYSLSYPWRHPAPRSIHQDGLSDLFPAAGLLCNNPIQPSRPSTKVTRLQDSHATFNR
ncbi:hypothetical protein BRADI_4g05462v3 [Brachypodium distachyon]|uniref:Uncharacterized protein n=1 Tax=Brachypodium distachyon TaxID=15368 RepID=A0A2K2CKN6_BRADI|nr:hypothetical protein BRADI_4g05462v3 [Brachypodium distachyon]